MPRIAAATLRMDDNIPPVGAAVKLRDLQSRPDLNGVIGICNGEFEEGNCPIVAEIDSEYIDFAFLRY